MLLVCFRLEINMFVLVFLVVLLFLLAALDIKKPNNFPPGPKWLPLIGSLATIETLRRKLGYLYLACNNLAEIYGPIIGLRLGRIPVVIVSDTAGIQEIFTREEFSGRPNGFFFRMRTFGKNLGLVFSDGAPWQQQRKFALQQLKQFGLGKREMEENIIVEALGLIDKLKKKQNMEIQVQNMFDVSVINVLWVMVAGERFNFKDQRLRELLDIIHEQFRASDTSGGLLNQLPFLRHIFPELSGYKQHKNTLNRLWTFLETTIEEHKRLLSLNSPPKDFIEAFLQQQVQKGEKDYNNEQLLSVCMDLFMAGSETTANTLEFIVLFLVKYPQVQKQIHLELDETIGRDRVPTLHDKVKLPFIQAVISEVQRCAHIVPLGLGHRCTRDTTLLGYQIPKDTILFPNLHSLHTNQNFWKDPELFRPQRFLNLEEKETEVFFAPFGNGKRRCLGESLAKANIFLMIATLLHTYVISAPPETGLPTLEAYDGFTLSPKPFKVIFTERT